MAGRAKWYGHFCCAPFLLAPPPLPRRLTPQPPPSLPHHPSRSAWKELGELSRDESRAAYVSFVDEFFPGWESAAEKGRNASAADGGSDGASSGDSDDNGGDDGDDSDGGGGTSLFALPVLSCFALVPLPPPHVCAAPSRLSRAAAASSQTWGRLSARFSGACERTGSWPQTTAATAASTPLCSRTAPSGSQQPWPSHRRRTSPRATMP